MKLNLNYRGNEWVYFGVVALVLLVLFGDTLALGADAVSGSDAFTKWDALFKKYGAQYGVPWRWLKAIAMQESQLGADPSVQEGLLNPDDIEGSKSQDGLSWGLMQVTLKTGQALMPGVTVRDLNNPDTSVKLAAMLLAQLIGTFGIDDRESVVRAYNGGPHFGTATLPYYGYFVTHMAIILQTQPGDEMETS